MITCSLCHAWRPKQWDGGKWADVSAACIYKGGPFAHDHTCDHASLVCKHTGRNQYEDMRADLIKQIGGKLDVPQQRPPATIQPIIGLPGLPASRAIRKPTLQGSWENSSDLSDGNTPELYLHQQEAVEDFDYKTEIALFFEMGVGKSATILAIVARKFKRQEIDALLVVAPNDVHRQWAVEQIPLWLGVPYELQCLYGRGGAKQAYPFDEDPEMLQVVCVNIDTFSTPSKWKDVVEWANSRKTFIVLDEATVIKNVNAQRTQRMLYEFNQTQRKGKTIIASKSNSVARAILTGTPVTNGAMDLWAMMEFLRPNFFGRNWYSFQNYFGMFTRMAVGDREINVPLTEDWWNTIKGCKTYGEAHAICGCSEDTYNVIHSQEQYQGPYKHADELRALIQPVSRFKLLTECVDMPAQIYNTRTLTMADEHRKCYDSMVDEFIATYETHTATALNKLSVMIRLQQISSGFLCDKNMLVINGVDDVDRIHRIYDIEDIDDEDILPDEIKWIGMSNPKLDALYRDIEELAKPIIIITRFTAEASRIYNDLCNKHSCCLVTGWKRVGTLDEFKAGKYNIMIANVAAIARGFNLQNSHVMLFYSNTFSLELRLQAEGRIFRLGQTSPCEYIDYTYNDSIDEKIVSALLLKRNLLDYMRQADMKELVA